MIASPICGAGKKHKHLVRSLPKLPNNLFYEMKGRLLHLKIKSSGYSVALSQSLRGAKLGLGRKKYNYRSEVQRIHSRMFGESFGFVEPYKDYNTISHSQNKKSFIISFSDNFKKL